MSDPIRLQRRGSMSSISRPAGTGPRKGLLRTNSMIISTDSGIAPSTLGGRLLEIGSDNIDGRNQVRDSGLFSIEPCGHGSKKFKITLTSRDANGNIDRKTFKHKLSSFSGADQKHERRQLKYAVETCSKFRDNPYSISKDEIEQLENFSKSLPKDSDFFKEVQDSLVGIKAHIPNAVIQLNDMLENNEIDANFAHSGIAQMAAKELLGGRCEKLKQDISHASPDAILKLHADTEALSSTGALPENFPIKKDLEGIAQSYFDNISPNPPTEDSIPQLASDYEQLRSFLSQNSSPKIIQQAAQTTRTHLKNACNDVCQTLQFATNSADPQQFEEAYNTFQKLCPNATVPEEITQMLSSAIRNACENVKQAEQELETASAAYAALPEENFYYDDLNEIKVYEQHDLSHQIAFTFTASNFIQHGPREDLNNASEIDKSSLEKAAKNLSKHKKELSHVLKSLRKELRSEGGKTPKSLKMATQKADASLESLENALKTEISSLKEGTHTISENLDKALKEAENAYRELGEIAGPAIKEAFEKCAEARAKEASKRAKEEANRRAEIESQRNLAFFDYLSAEQVVQFMSREGLESTCLSLGKFLASDDPALDEVEKLVPGFKEKLNAPEKGPDSQEMRDWQEKYGDPIDYSDLPPPPDGFDPLPPPPGDLGDLPPLGKSMPTEETGVKIRSHLDDASSERSAIQV